MIIYLLLSNNNRTAMNNTNVINYYYCLFSFSVMRNMIKRRININKESIHSCMVYVFR